MALTNKEKRPREPSPPEDVASSDSDRPLKKPAAKRKKKDAAGATEADVVPKPKKKSREKQKADEGEENPEMPTEDTKDAKKKQSRELEKQRKKRAVIEVVEDKATLSKYDKEPADLVSLLLQSSDRTLKNTLRIATLLKHSKLRQCVKPTQPPPPDYILSDALAGMSPVPGRAIYLDTVTRNEKKSAWFLRFGEQDNSGSKLVTTTPSRSMYIDVSYANVASGDMTTIDKIARQVVKMLNAWPFPALLWTQQAIRMLREVALTIEVPALPLRIPEVRIKGQEVYTITVDYFDPQGGEKKRTITMHPTDAWMSNIEVPRLPTLRIGLETEAATVSHPNWPYLGRPTKCAEKTTSAKSQRKAQDVLRYLAMRCTGIVATDRQIDAVVEYWRSSLGFASTKNLRPGMYGGTTFYGVFVHIAGRRTRIVFTAAVQSDIQKLRPVVYINSINANRATPALDSGIQTYVLTPDIRHAVIETAKMGDEVNLEIAEGVPPSSACENDNDSGGPCMDLHPCECCTGPCDCRTRAYDRFGRLVDPKCLERQKLAAQQDRKQGETMAQGIARRSFELSFRRECRLRGIDPALAPQPQIIETALRSLMSRLSDENGPPYFVDEYTGRTEEIKWEVPQIAGNVTRRRTTATMLSVDAKWPRMPSTTDPKTYYVHAEDNLAITTTTCQYAKFTFIVGILQVISDYRKIDKPTPADRTKLLQALRNFQLLRLKQKYTQAARTSEKVDQQNHDDQMLEWRSGKPTPGEHGPWEVESSRYVSRTVPSTTAGYLWDDKTRTRLGNLARKISKRFNKPLFYTEEGVPWPGPKETMPEGWSWNSWAVFCIERLKRMRVICNKKWVTKDTDESLFAEIFWQHCTDDPKYGDGLGLPLVVWMHHPLRLSVAHRHHGFGMFSGWPPRPSDPDERQDDQNNMLIESWYWNCCKQDMDESYYLVAMEILKSITLSTNDYDPTLAPPTSINHELVGMESIEGQEEFPGEPIDEEAAGAEDDDPDRPTTAAVAGTGQGEEDGPGEDVAPGEEDGMELGLEGLAVGAAGAGDGEVDEVTSLSATTKDLRALIAQEHRDKFIDDPQVARALVQLQDFADAGDRGSHQTLAETLMVLVNTELEEEGEGEGEEEDEE